MGLGNVRKVKKIICAEARSNKWTGLNGGRGTGRKTKMNQEGQKMKGWQMTEKHIEIERTEAEGWCPTTHKFDRSGGANIGFN